MSGLNEITLICVQVADQDRSLDFYVGKLGLEKRVDVPFGNGMRWIQVYPPSGTAGIALAPPPNDAPITPLATGITFETDAIDATHAELAAAGVDVDAEIMRMGGNVPDMFWLRDPDGHSLLVVQTAS